MPWSTNTKSKWRGEWLYLPVAVPKNFHWEQDTGDTNWFTWNGLHKIFEKIKLWQTGVWTYEARSGGCGGYIPAPGIATAHPNAAKTYMYKNAFYAGEKILTFFTYCELECWGYFNTLHRHDRLQRHREWRLQLYTFVVQLHVACFDGSDVVTVATGFLCI